MFLNVVFETFSNGYKAIFLDFISLISIFFGISIIVSKNPILSVLFLIGLFFSISIYLMMLGLYFLGLSYLLVYVGAISILFLFILMLINVRISELLTDTKNSVFLAIIAVLSFNLPVNEALPYCVSIADLISSYLVSSVRNIVYNVFTSHIFNLTVNTNKIVMDSFSSVEVANVTSKLWDGTITEVTHITSIGNILYTSLFIFLVITSLILLLAMVGAIVITISKSSTIGKADTGKTYQFISSPLQSSVLTGVKK